MNGRLDLPVEAAPSGVTRSPGKWTWWLAGVAAVVIVLLAVIAARLFSTPPLPEHWVVMRSELPIASRLVERHPAISPDGSMIAYSASRDDRGLSRQIYLQKVSGGAPLRRTNDPYDDTSPDWSPDGRQIAYVAYRPGEPCRLMIVPALAGSSHEVARCNIAERSHLVWSVSGVELFFLDRLGRTGRNRIMRLELATGRRTPLTHAPASSLGEDEPSLSPDGHWITFRRFSSKVDAQRIILDLRTGTERVVATAMPSRFENSATWSEDSSSIFVTTAHHSDYAIWAYPAAGGKPLRILSSPEELARMDSGPKGLLAVEMTRIYGGLARPPATGSNQPQFLEAENGEVHTPDIAADGTVAAAMAFASDSGIWLVPKQGPMRKIAALPLDETPDAEPRWAPDGQEIALSTISKDRMGVRVIARSGSQIAFVRFSGTSEAPPVWTADGKALIFPGLDKDGWRLWKVELDRPDHAVPLPQRGWKYIRNRGSELYGVRSDAAGVWRIDGTPRRITAAPEAYNAQQWTIVGDGIAYLDIGAAPRILVQPLEGGAPQVLAQAPGYIWNSGFAADPASHSILYVAKLSMDSDIELLHLAKQ